MCEVHVCVCLYVGVCMYADEDRAHVCRSYVCACIMRVFVYHTCERGLCACA